MPNIFLYGQIGQDHVAHVANVTKGQPNADELNIYISSLGGSVMSGLQIKAMIEGHSAQTKTFHIEGLAASIATFIPMIQGATISATEDSIFMIHNVSASLNGVSIEELRQFADSAEAQQNIIISAYERRSNLTRPEIVAFMNEEKHFTAREALEVGLIDSISAAHELVAMAKLETVDCLPDALKAKLMIDNLNIKKEAIPMPEEQNEVEELTADANQAGEVSEESEVEEVETEEIEEVEELEIEEVEEVEVENKQSKSLMDTLRDWFDNNEKLKNIKHDLIEAEEELEDAETEVLTLSNKLDEVHKELEEKNELIDAIQIDFEDHKQATEANEEIFNKVLENIVAGNLTALDLQDILDNKKSPIEAANEQKETGLIAEVKMEEIEEPEDHNQILSELKAQGKHAEARKYYIENIKNK